MADKKESTVVVYVSTYSNLDDANADYEAVKKLYFNGLIGVYDAAVISKSTDGQVKIHKTEMPTQYGAWSGLAVGALAGIFFPPFLVWELAVGAGAGALIGHLWGGLSSTDMKAIGEGLQQSTAAVIIIGRSRLREALAGAIKHAMRQFESELCTDTIAFNSALTDAVNRFLKAA